MRSTLYLLRDRPCCWSNPYHLLRSFYHCQNSILNSPLIEAKFLQILPRWVILSSVDVILNEQILHSSAFDWHVVAFQWVSTIQFLCKQILGFMGTLRSLKVLAFDRREGIIIPVMNLLSMLPNLERLHLRGRPILVSEYLLFYFLLFISSPLLFRCHLISVCSPYYITYVYI